MAEFKNLETGSVGLVRGTEDGRITQIGLSPEQSKLLQMFLVSIAGGKPLIQMPEEYDLVLKNDK